MLKVKVVFAAVAIIAGAIYGIFTWSAAEEETMQGTNDDYGPKTSELVQYTDVQEVLHVPRKNIPEEETQYEAPDYWLLDSYGIGHRIEDMEPGDVVGLLYSTWCPKVDESLPELIMKIDNSRTSYRPIALFPENEAEQLLDEAGSVELEEKTISALLQLKEKGLLVMDAPYVDGRFNIQKYRMPGEQWKKLGGKAGGLEIACFDNGKRNDCPKEILSIVKCLPDEFFMQLPEELQVMLEGKDCLEKTRLVEALFS